MFEAKKKLESIKKAEERAVTAEELIRFAHRISASGAVAAPPTWAPGKQYALRLYVIVVRMGN